MNTEPKTSWSWRLPLIIAVLHVVVIGLFYYLWQRPVDEVTPPTIRASLARLPVTPAPATPVESPPPPAANPTPEPQPAPTPKPTPAPAPQPTPKPTAKPTPNPQPTPKPTAKPAPADPKPAWRPRTPEEIRRSAGAKTTPTPKRSPTSPAAPNTDWQAVRDQLSQELAKGTVSISAGRAEAVPESYQQQLMALLYDTWKQPTRAQVADARLQVRVELAIARSGRFTAKQLVAASDNAAMDASARQLLNDLSAAPPLPAEISVDPLRVTVTLVLRR